MAITANISSKPGGAGVSAGVSVGVAAGVSVGIFTAKTLSIVSCGMNEAPSS